MKRIFLFLAVALAMLYLASIAQAQNWTPPGPPPVIPMSPGGKGVAGGDRSPINDTPSQPPPKVQQPPPKVQQPPPKVQQPPPKVQQPPPKVQQPPQNNQTDKIAQLEKENKNLADENTKLIDENKQAKEKAASAAKQEDFNIDNVKQAGEAMAIRAGVLAFLGGLAVAGLVAIAVWAYKTGRFKQLFGGSNKGERLGVSTTIRSEPRESSVSSSEVTEEWSLVKGDDLEHPDRQETRHSGSWWHP